MNEPTTTNKKTWSNWVHNLLEYFNVKDDLLPQAEVEQSIRDGVSFRGSQLLVLIFAIFIASLGLNTNNVAVIIGAMLISPLMGPIMGMGLALGTEDFTLLRKGLKNIVMAILGSVIASAVYFLISPQYEGSSQLLARTSPSIYDVFIALFGGAAGIVSTACRNKGQVMPGVAIATSLMPPLCTAGYGIATLQLRFFAGAFYLFFTNMIFILFATWIGVKVMGYKRHSYEITKRYRRVQALVYSVVTVTIIVSAYLTFQMISKNVFLNRAAAFVEDQMVFPNTQVLNHSEYIQDGKRHINVTLIGAPLPKDSLQLAMTARLDSLGLGGTILTIKQGFSIQQEAASQDDDRFYELMLSQLSERDNSIDSLKRALTSASTLDKQSTAISPEIKVLFPTVRDIALSRMVATSTADSLQCDTLDMAFINAPAGLSTADRAKLKNYISVRLNMNDIHLAVNPPGFPWPQRK